MTLELALATFTEAVSPLRRGKGRGNNAAAHARRRAQAARRLLDACKEAHPDSAVARESVHLLDAGLKRSLKTLDAEARVARKGRSAAAVAGIESAGVKAADGEYSQALQELKAVRQAVLDHAFVAHGLRWGRSRARSAEPEQACPPPVALVRVREPASVVAVAKPLCISSVSAVNQEGDAAEVSSRRAHLTSESAFPAGDEGLLVPRVLNFAEYAWESLVAAAGTPHGDDDALSAGFDPGAEDGSRAKLGQALAGPRVHAPQCRLFAGGALAVAGNEAVEGASELTRVEEVLDLERGTENHQSLADPSRVAGSSLPAVHADVIRPRAELPRVDAVVVGGDGPRAPSLGAPRSRCAASGWGSPKRRRLAGGCERTAPCADSVSQALGAQPGALAGGAAAPLVYLATDEAAAGALNEYAQKDVMGAADVQGQAPREVSKHLGAAVGQAVVAKSSRVRCHVDLSDSEAEDDSADAAASGEAWQAFFEAVPRLRSFRVCPDYHARLPALQQVLDACVRLPGPSSEEEAALVAAFREARRCVGNLSAQVHASKGAAERLRLRSSFMLLLRELRAHARARHGLDLDAATRVSERFSTASEPPPSLSALRLRCSLYKQTGSCRHLCPELCYYREYEPERQLQVLRQRAEAHPLRPDITGWVAQLQVTRRQPHWRVIFVDPIIGRTHASVEEAWKAIVDRALAEPLPCTSSGPCEAHAGDVGCLQEPQCMAPVKPMVLDALHRGGACSPFGLIEELLQDDPWQLLVACVLLNRVRRVSVDRLLGHFFLRWPGPREILRAAPESVEQVLAPLGLLKKRAHGLRHLASDYLLALSEDGSPLPSHRVAAMPGLGKYACDAYELFVRRSDPSTLRPSDVYLRWYANWAAQRDRHKATLR